MEPRSWHASYDPEVPPTLAYPEATLPELLTQIAQTFPDRPAIHYFGTAWTYAELERKVNQFANLLKAEGVLPGDKVALYLPNFPAVVVAFYGALRAGCVLTQLNPLYVPKEAAYQLMDSGAKVVVALDRFAETLRGLSAECGLKKVWLVRINDDFPVPLKWFYALKARFDGTWVSWPREPLFRSFREELARMDSQGDFARLDQSELALLQYTGGTTGLAKGVMLTHRNLVVNAVQTRAWVPQLVQGRETVMVAVPIFHCYGMTVGMNLAVLLGAAMVLAPKFDVVRVMKDIAKYRAGVFPGVQAMYLAINQHPDAKKYDLSCIKACLSGAGPLHGEVQRIFESLTGGRFVEGYGMTEASPVTHANPIQGKRKIGSVGVPFPDTEAKIVDLETGTKEMPLGTPGEIIVRGPQVMQGYWNKPKETAESLRDGWLFTGDIGTMDAEGFFVITDRKKDMIKVGGENVYPREIEEALFKHPAIQDCVVAGVPDDKLVDKVKAYVVLKPGTEATSDHVIGYCKENLAKYKVPREVEFREALPKNMVGKMLRRVLIEEEKAKRTKP